NMGTTCVSAHFVESAGAAKAIVAHAGDSRVYHLREGKLRRITIDHSLVEEYLRQGKISEEEARTFPQKNIILRALGQQRGAAVAGAANGRWTTNVVPVSRSERTSTRPPCAATICRTM